MSKTAITLMLVTLISKITGLLREQFYAYFLGTGQLIDVYNTASTIPSIIFSFVLAGVVAGYIPIYSKIETNQGRDKAIKFTSNLANTLIVITTIIMIFIEIFAPLLVSLFASGYSGEKRDLTIQFTRIMSLSVYTGVAASVFIGYLQIKNRFLVAETPGIIMNVLNIVFVILASYLKNIYILAIGFIITEYLKYFLFPKALKSEGYFHSFKINLKDENLLQILKTAIPIIISIAAVDLSTISDQSFASRMLEHGGVSSMRYASLILQLVHGVIVVSITTAIYPTLSRFATERKMKALKRTLRENTNYTLILILPAMIGIMILANPVIKLLFQRGSFNSESTAITAGVLFYYMPTVIGQSINQIYTRGFYAQQNTKDPIIVTFVQVGLNITLNAILSQIWGLNGLAIATSVSSFIGGILSIYLFKKKYGMLNISHSLISIIKISIASIIMGIFTYKIYELLSPINYIFALIGSIAISALIYAFIIIFMRIPEVKKLLNKLYRKYRK